MQTPRLAGRRSLRIRRLDWLQICCKGAKLKECKKGKRYNTHMIINKVRDGEQKYCSK